MKWWRKSMPEPESASVKRRRAALAGGVAAGAAAEAGALAGASVSFEQLDARTRRSDAVAARDRASGARFIGTTCRGRWLQARDDGRADRARPRRRGARRG